MQRLLAEVMKIRKLKPIQDNNFLIFPIRCKVKIRDGAAKGFRLPPRVKMKRGWIKRMCVSPWEIREKDLIILTSEETRLFIPKIEGDINLDGFKEELLENEFLKILVLPHYGAKIGSLIYKASGEDKFKLGIKYEKDEWIDMGGSDDLIDEELPGSLWNADFTVTGDKLLRYFKYEKKGIKIVKHIKLLDGLPILSAEIEIKSKKEKEVNFWQRLSFPPRQRRGKAENNWWENVVYIPTNGGLKHKRYSKAGPLWFPYEYYGLDLGAFLFANNNGNFLWITNPDLLDFLMINTDLIAMRVIPYYVSSKLKKNGSIKYNFLWAIGESSEISSQVIAIGSRAILPDNKLLFSIIARSKKQINYAKVWFNKKEKRIHLKPLNIKGIGKILVGTNSIRASPNTPIKFKLIT